jgi:hypothetical protein
MKRMLYGLAIAVLVTVAMVAEGGEAPASKPRVPPGWSFSFPDGNAKSGQAVFMQMECYSCHRITIPGEKLPTNSGGIGPDLTTGYAQLPKEYLAEAIIKAHTVVAAPGYEVKAGQAGMGKYNHFLTVQELTDLVAFLKHPPGAGE